MSNYRNISDSFWNDSKIDDDFTPEDKYFYLYLLTNPHTNICGCYEISMKQMERETGYTENTINRLLNRMDSTHNVIRYSPTTKEILVLKWHKYNWSKSEKLITAVNKVAAFIKNHEFQNYVLTMANENVECEISSQIPDNRTQITDNRLQITDTDVSIPYAEGMDTVSKSKKAKHKYGEFKNVLLSDDEIEKLKEKCSNYTSYIDKLSLYIEQSGKAYKSHYAVILDWSRKDAIDKFKDEELPF